MDIQSSTTIPEVQKTIVMLRELSTDEKVRQQVYYREKRLHDEATALNGARREGRVEGRVEGRAEMLQKLYVLGNTIEQLSQMFNMPAGDVQELLAMEL